MFRPFRALLAAAAAACLLCLSFARADEHPTGGKAVDVLVLSNGDRLTGEKVKEENGTVYFRSAALGLLALPADQVKLESSHSSTDLELQLANTAAPEATAAPLVPAQPKPAPAAPPPVVTATPAPSAPPAAARHDSPSPASLWKRTLEVGVTSQTGRIDRKDLSLRTNLERRTDSNELRMQARYLYGETGDARSTDNMGANARVRQDLSPRTFVQSEVRYDRDTIKRLRHDAAQSIGVGRKVFDRADLRLALGGGFAARYRDTLRDGAEWNYLVDAFQDLSYSINSHFKITQALSLLVAPFEDDEYLVKLNTALTTKLTNTLNMSMRYELEYDRSLLPDARESQRIVTSLGYAF